jgi:hypothetical protein
MEAVDIEDLQTQIYWLEQELAGTRELLDTAVARGPARSPAG